MKYFVFNKPLDFERGYMEHCHCTDGYLELEQGCQQGSFFSRVLDSREKGNIWHRLTMELPAKASQVQVRIYSSDSDLVALGGTQIPVNMLLRDRSVPEQEKLRMIAPMLQLEFTNESDTLLHQVKGRYLWFYLALYSGYDGQASAGNLMLYFPKETWMQYLPAIYGKEPKSADFLERYLGVFQSAYDDFGRQLERAPALLDPVSTPSEYLNWLAGWLDIAHTYLWSQDKLRKLIQKAPELYRIRGTRKAILEIVELYTGEQPLLVEFWQIEPYLQDENAPEILERLYGSDPNSYVLLVKEEYVLQTRDREALMTVLEEASPAHICVNLGVLKPFIFLGDYCYLGVNSRLGAYRNVQLDGKSMLPFAAIGRKE